MLGIHMKKELPRPPIMHYSKMPFRWELFAPEILSPMIHQIDTETKLDLWKERYIAYYQNRGHTVPQLLVFYVSAYTFTYCLIPGGRV